jgi:hypothetical protein
VALRAGLARFAVTNTPVPVGWARSWAWYHPSLFPQTPQSRCPEEFDRLFAVRFHHRYPSGLAVPDRGRPPVRIGYEPASPGIDSVVLERPDLPDVLEEPRATRELGALTDSVTEALTPYSRWLARTPGGAGTLASTALLPADLLDATSGPLRPVLSWADRRLDGRRFATIGFAELRDFWSTTDPARMSRDEAEALALVLARAGLGVEPDVRFGGPPLARGPVVLFRLNRDAAPAPSPGYRAAATMLHLAADVLRAAPPLPGTQPASCGAEHAGHITAGDGDPAARGTATDGAVTRAITELSTELWLPVAERSRLAHWLRWLLVAGPAAPRPERRISALTATERDTAGHLLVRVALSGPPPTPATVTALTRAYRLLGLDPELVYRRLHQQSIEPARALTPRSGPAPTDDPVVVRRARPGPVGRALPRARPTSQASTTPTADPVDRPSPASRGVPLDRQAIARKLAETQQVSLLLAGILTDDGPGTPAARPPAPVRSASPAVAAPASPVGHGSSPDACDNRAVPLDPAHLGLLREIAARPSWSLAGFAQVAARHGLLPAGALDVLNDAAIQVTGEPAVEGEDELTVNDAAVRELQA